MYKYYIATLSNTYSKSPALIKIWFWQTPAKAIEKAKEIAGDNQAIRVTNIVRLF
ncbi:hypothetical protein KLEA5_gp21 [Aeromonas phage vB_AveS_KLEA5]|nr:hypothetical protein KLEA5_gp21 [Aeromonas phage vB_AveS_KLEA5]